MREKRDIFLFNRFRTLWTVINLKWWWSARRRKLHVERVCMVQAVNIIQYIERLEALIAWQLMRQFTIIGLGWTCYGEKAIASFQMGNDIQESPPTMVDSQLFKYTNPNSVLSSSTASLLATFQTPASTVGTGVIRWFKFALCRSGTKFFEGQYRSTCYSAGIALGFTLGTVKVVSRSFFPRISPFWLLNPDISGQP